MSKPQLSNLTPHLYVVILCGGGGTRLWPLSRNKTPKQFIDLLGKETLFEKTLVRAQTLVPSDHIYIMTNVEYLSDVKKSLGDIPPSNVITEPEKKNTALAMGVIAGLIHHRDPQAVVINLASDHLITDSPAFTHAMQTAALVASEGKYFVTVGIKPTFAHTGYGYIHAGKLIQQEEGLQVFESLGFKEKPDQVTAQQYVTSGQYFWNANLYTWKTSLILAEFARLSPSLSAPIQTIMKSIDTPQFEQVFTREYHSAPEEQIDTAISEHTDKLLVIPGDFGWTDVGSWNVVHDEIKQDQDGNALVTRDHGAEWIGIDTQNSLISTGNKLIVTLGVANLMIVDTDDALLIVHKDRAQEVKKVVEKLKADHRDDLL